MQRGPLALLLITCLFLTSFYSQVHSFGYSATWKDSLPVLEVAADFNAKNTASSDRLITLSSGTYNDRFQPDSFYKTGYYFVAVKVGDVNKVLKRVPLNISIVVDRSGSMAGEKIDFAKKAAKRIVDRLDSTDYVSIIEYDNFISVLQKATLDSNKKQIKTRIEKLAARGSTNLWGGTEKGYEETMTNYKPGFINRVLLISDGQANVGITNPATIKYKVRQYRDSGISLSTFGVGPDYNELLMTEMAQTGHGNYYFIDSVNKMTMLFERELASMLSLAARKAKLTISTPPDVALTMLTDESFEQHGNELVINLDDLFSKETKSYLFRYVLVNKVKKPFAFHTTLAYNDLHENQADMLTSESVLAPAKDKKTYSTHFNQEVTNQVIMFAVANNLDRALLVADAGNYVAARELLVLNDNYLKSNSFYVAHSGTLQKIDAVNKKYLSSLATIKKLNADGIKMLQKLNRDALYQIRNNKED